MTNLKFNLEKCYVETKDELIQNLKSGYKNLEKWQSTVKLQAVENGYTETYLGRRRYFKIINRHDS